MSDFVRLLPDSLANQIAAGEVVQRPASVVKELLENAIDAQATEVVLVVKDAGKSLIRVTDNGTGMSETDARMSLERHSTSKINCADDLFAIRTFGFRGEALSSIVAVAQVDIKTRQQEAQIGTKIKVAASQVHTQEPEACPAGTSILVRNLFYNVPARRKFLKSNPVEMRHILVEFHRVALANPEVAFSLYQDDLETISLKPGKFSRRIIDIFGKNYASLIVPCEEQLQETRIWGYLGKPEAARKTRGEQYFFVNGRFIKHPYLNHAVVSAYEGMLKQGYFPFYAICIQIPPQRLDVNIHPTKTEVKFDEERSIYALVNAAVKKSLTTHHIAASLDFKTDVNFIANVQQNAEQNFKNLYTEKWAFKHTEMPRNRENTKNWQALYTLPQSKISENTTTAPKKTTLGSAANLPAGTGKHQTKPAWESDEKKEQQVIQLHNKYILLPFRSGIMVIDQKAAFERIIFDKYSRHTTTKTASQKILFPQSVSLPKTDFELLETHKNEIAPLGISWEVFGENTLCVNGLPPELDKTDCQELLETFAEQLKNHLNPKEHVSEKIRQTLAKRIAGKMEKNLEKAEIFSLVKQLFAGSNPNFTPEGKKIVELLSLEDLEKLF